MLQMDQHWILKLLEIDLISSIYKTSNTKCNIGFSDLMLRNCNTMQVMLRQLIHHSLIILLYILSLSVALLRMVSKFVLLMEILLKKLSSKQIFHTTKKGKILVSNVRGIPMKNNLMTSVEEFSLQGQLKRENQQRSLSLEELRRTFSHVINT